MQRCDVSSWLFSRWAFGTFCCVLAAITAAAQAEPGGPSGHRRAALRAVASDAEFVEFERRVATVAALRDGVARTLPELPADATAEQIDHHRRELRSLVASKRAAARQGDVFVALAQGSIRARLTRVLTGADRSALRQTIEEERPEAAELTVNGPYPARVALAMMPPDVLAALPPLPGGLEYRFVGEALILLDSSADLVIDFLPDVLPR